ncbi:MAG: AI-2E family transporter YdiK [Betaproteobacteria bacterium]|nr:MAG: AI-2E family transporter YdiK [Betaproteobacteria bacterium]
MSVAPRELARTTFVVLVLGGLIAASLWIVKPFLPSLVWAAMIVIATWPLLLRLQRRLWGRRWLAVSVMTLALLLTFVVPLSLAIAAAVGNAGQIVAWAKSLATMSLPQPPQWVESLPIAGEAIASAWRDLAAAGWQELAKRAAPYADVGLRWLAGELGDAGLIVVQLLLTVLLCAILYAEGEAAAARLRRFGVRLAGARGEAAVGLAGKAVRAVALGVVVTALVQALAGGLGLLLAGVPFAGVLTALMFVLAVAQIGAVPVLACAVIWLWWGGEAGVAVALLVWSIFVGALDNVLRPILIRQGADLPLLLIFAGVIGGIIGFGLIGIFVGPVVLAVAYTLLEDWMNDEARRG